MKTLVLVRHGKSSWKHDVSDKQRPLKKRAFKDADLVIKTFKSQYLQPFFMWSSPATRAFETAKIFKERLSVDDEHFQINEALYTFDEAELLHNIYNCDDSVERLMVFGHNPAITEVANQLGDKIFDNVPTTGLVMINFKSDSWADLKNGKTLLHLFPKNLR